MRLIKMHYVNFQLAGEKKTYRHELPDGVKIHALPNGNTHILSADGAPLFYIPSGAMISFEWNVRPILDAQKVEPVQHVEPVQKVNPTKMPGRTIPVPTPPVQKVGDSTREDTVEMKLPHIVTDIPQPNVRSLMNSPHLLDPLTTVPAGMLNQGYRGTARVKVAASKN